MTINLTLPGRPYTKKTSNRIVRFGHNREHVKVLPSEAYCAWEATMMVLGPRIRHELAGVSLPITVPVSIEARVYRATRTGDLTGYQQAIGDVLQAPVIRDGRQTRNGLGIIKDDALIEHWDAHLDHDPANPRIELRISTLQPVQEGML